MLRIISIFCILVCSATAFAKDTPSQLAWAGYIKLEDVSNVAGGLKTGSVFDGGAKLVAIYDQAFKLGILGSTHTRSLHQYVNSIQTISSLNSEREIIISDLSYEGLLSPHVFGRIGVMDLEDYYDIMEGAIYLRNSTFSNTEAWNANTEIASFPFPGIGAMLKFFDQKSYALLGVYQGDPQRLHTVFYSGYMLIAEAGTSTPVQHGIWQDLSLKAGAWIYQAGVTPGYTNSRGAYLISQLNWQYKQQAMAVFLQVSFSDESPKYVPCALTAGVMSNNIFLSNNHDWLTFGFGNVWIHDLPSEVLFEVSYVIRFCDKFYLTPDFQYFIKPSGVNPNATLLALNLSYKF